MMAEFRWDRPCWPITGLDRDVRRSQESLDAAVAQVFDRHASAVLRIASEKATYRDHLLEALVEDADAEGRPALSKMAHNRDRRIARSAWQCLQELAKLDRE